MILLTFFVGCGSTLQRTATEQLLMSDAVDAAVSKINFEPLAGQRVYLDTTYLTQVNGPGFVNAQYIIGSIRQQMTGSRCLLQDSKSDAQIIVEARVGTLGTDSHEITYGLPATSGLSTAASLFSNGTPVPVIPEISFGKSDSQSAVAKVVLFAYDKDTRDPIWQSGISKAESNSRNTWLMGAGPFQKGTIHEGFRFAGSRVDKGRNIPGVDQDISYFDSHLFGRPLRPVPQVAEAPESTEKK